GGRCVAVSAVSPGIVYEDRVALAPNVPGWEELELPALLRDRFGLTRAAAAIVADGEVIQGANGAAGEIGYSLRGTCESTGAAEGRAPLEEFAGGRAIGERASALLGAPMTAADVFDDP